MTLKQSWEFRGYFCVTWGILCATIPDSTAAATLTIFFGIAAAFCLFGVPALMRWSGMSDDAKE